MSIFDRFLRGDFKSQIVIIPGEDRTVRKADYPIILPGYVSNPEKKGAWHLLHTMSVPLQGTVRRVVVLPERSTIPYNPHVKLSDDKIKKLTDKQQLAREAFLRAKIEALNESRNNFIGICLVIVAALAVLGVLLMFFMNMMNSGKIHLLVPIIQTLLNS